MVRLINTGQAIPAATSTASLPGHRNGALPDKAALGLSTSPQASVLQLNFPLTPVTASSTTLHHLPAPTNTLLHHHPATTTLHHLPTATATLHHHPTVISASQTSSLASSYCPLTLLG